LNGEGVYIDMQRLQCGGPNGAGITVLFQAAQLAGEQLDAMLGCCSRGIDFDMVCLRAEDSANVRAVGAAEYEAADAMQLLLL
jgi:hypothetical protein